MHPGTLLKSVREDRGYSLRKLARKSGYSPGYIADIESGRRLPRVFALECILVALAAHEKRQEFFEIYYLYKSNLLFENLALLNRKVGECSF
ncbi:helix-turn-helix domain-containing protein [Oligoflexus tunisiensis]|uniref:helix-turn-helix domain-containing protein n=1 Tax=Oligoflexus tunisiensis TaxID=708132 RepID=UPI00114CC691